MTNVIGLYDNPRQAQKALTELFEAGICDHDLMADQAARDRNLDDHLSEFGIDRHSAHVFAEAVRQGRMLVNVRPSIERADEALQILKRNGAREFEDLAGEVRQAERAAETQPAETPPIQAEEAEPTAVQAEQPEEIASEQERAEQQAKGGESEAITEAVPEEAAGEQAQPEEERPAG